jgi:hypothetical protein
VTSACTPDGTGPGPDRAGDDDDSPTGDTAVVTVPVDTAVTATGDTGGTTIPYDCASLPDVPLSVTSYNIETTEDFDFDAQGRMVYATWLGSTLEGVDQYGNFEVIAAGIHDTRGIQVLSSGLIAIAYISEGRVGLTDPTTGASWTVISNLSGPNALEVGDGDILYVSETGWGGGGVGPRVQAFDLATGEATAVAGGFGYPNGLAINNAQDTLYVSDSSDGIWAVPKNADGTWGAKYLVYNPPDFNTTYDGMEVDVCDNLYVLGFGTGQLVRFDPETLEGVTLADLEDPQAFLWNAIRWGSNRGGWRRDVLYVTDRNKVFGVEVGISGRPQPVDLVP